MYADVNRLFGDIVKVTPSSKSVGDMALFLITNNLTTDDVLDSKRELAFPESVVDLIAGRHFQRQLGFDVEGLDRLDGSGTGTSSSCRPFNACQLSVVVAISKSTVPVAEVVPLNTW